MLIEITVAAHSIAGGINCVAFIRDISQQKLLIGLQILDVKSLKALINNASAPIIGIDSDDRITLWNDAVAALSGYSKKEVLGATLASLVDSESACTHLQTLQAGQGSTYEMVLASKEGEPHQLLLSSSPQYNRHGDVVGCISIGQDITVLKAAHLENQNVAMELRALIDTANAPIFGTDNKGRINEWNHMAERLTGYSKKQVLGQNLIDNFITEDFKEAVKSVLDDALTGRETVNYEFPLYSQDGSRVDVLLNSTTRRDAQGRIVGVVGVGQDVTELNRTRKLFERQLNTAANNDVLTGLPNRRYFYDHLQQQLTVQKGTGFIGSLLFLDLDWFKLVNDSLGHSIGDQLLKIVAKRLLASVRADDLVCRLGGDEFVILLSFKSVTSAQVAAENAKKIATNITGALSQPVHVEDHLLTAYGSIGICSFTAADSVEAIITRADNAMYLAKGDTNTHIAFYTDAVHQQLMHKMQVLEGIDEGLKEDHFFMHYQPQFNHDQELIGVEALIRWQHPRLGLLLPDQFIGVAEQYHRIKGIGAWVIESVFSQVAQWTQAGVKVPKVAINVSAMQLIDENFTGVVNAFAEQYSINPEGVVFEITESTDIEHFNLIRTVLVDLKTRGYRFSLDDFGTGYASMTNFKRLPLSQVKIDQSFIVDNEESLAIVGLVVTMARSLKLEVIAEGVETTAQLARLNKLGCTGYQGYLFSKALGVQAITELMADD